MNPQNNQYQPQQQTQESSFGMPTANNPYQIPQPANHKKQIFMMLGGGILIIVLLLWIVFGGRGTPGEADMQRLMQNTSDAVGILDEYQNDVSFSGTKNDLALALIILRGNHQTLNEIYKKAYKSKKSFSATPKPDSKSEEVLESAKRDNKLDTEIVAILQPKITAAQNALKSTAPNFSSKESKEKLAKASEDFQAVAEILADQQ